MPSPLYASAFLHHIATAGATGAAARFDTIALQGLYDIQAGPGSCSCRLAVTHAVCNRYDTLHGGCIATLVDVVGSAALYAVSDRGGVSLSITTTYLNPLPLGEEAFIEARVIKLGRSIATIEVTISDGRTSGIVATGTHVKFIAPSNPTLPELLTESERQQLEQQLCGGSRGSASKSDSASTQHLEEQQQQQANRPRSRL